MVMGNS